MDLYSFAMLCFWLLFSERLVVTARPSRDFLDEGGVLAFAQPNSEDQIEDILQALKLEDRLPDVAHQLLMELDIAPRQRGGLDQFFRSNLSSDPIKRIPDFGQLIKILEPNR
jgi:hypothetical protein